MGRRFPVLLGGRLDGEYRRLGVPRFVPWSILQPHEDQAKKNHSQSLEELARRGGLCPAEILAVLRGEPWMFAAKLTPKQIWEQLRPLLT
jgi:hypothetical protein